MKDLTLRYFDAEMRYLREAAKEFAEAHPDRAAALDLDRAGVPDPYVERLFEGFAFSMGRLREKLDDDLPELTEGLVSLLWPHYLRTIPSLSVVEMAPPAGNMKMSETVPAGFEILSQPVGPKKTQCRYRTTQDLTLQPVSLSKVELLTEPDGRSAIRLRFVCSDLTDWTTVDLSQLRFYLNGDAPLTCALHLALTKRQASMSLSFFYHQGRVAEPQPLAGHFSPGGFAEDDRLWPKGDTAFSGYQLLLEYFTFREKFMFVYLNGLEKVTFPENITGFDIDIVLSELWDHQLPISTHHLRLHCVPVINLFKVEADPLIINGLESEYLLRPRRLQDGHTEIYSVDEVVGSLRTDDAVYVPFTSFRHRGGMLRRTAPERYYHTRVKRGVSGLHDTWLILGGQAWEDDRLFERETVSLLLTGTNGQLPRKALQSTLLDRAEQALPVPLKIQNLCKPTLPAYPPAEDRFHWRVLSHLGSSFLNMMASAEVLRGTLALYNWLDDEMVNRKLDAIVDVKHFQTQRFEKGFLLRGIDIVVTLDANGFSGEGDINLFGEMLNRFFALYADIHLFNQLTLVIQPSGKHLRWKENHNQRIPG
ncbi:type VI secretion system baseplate subunit TssF [Serratia sp. DD3]|uniref:type VI secretion system baseplate subunit TssF n=1 Tax=Serratia sp. DD3 TaxID=1410619 RepID=UPI0003C4F975|nr:type VI secretion system baseplate subunit TssF [Serratia sp. DD3]KEY58907.1 type VI secretion protein, family [Serratia sp. DD3]